MIIFSYERRLKEFGLFSHANQRCLVAQGWRGCSSVARLLLEEGWGPCWELPPSSRESLCQAVFLTLFAFLWRSDAWPQWMLLSFGRRNPALALSMHLPHTHQVKPPSRPRLGGNLSIFSGCPSPCGIALFSVGAWLISEDYLHLFQQISSLLLQAIQSSLLSHCCF